MTVAKYTRPNNTTQSGSTYKANIDGAAQVFERISAAFAPHAQDTPDMTVRLDAGFIPKVGALATEVAAQTTAAITAPTTNPRKDIVYIDQTTGTVGIATGTEAASPSDPAVPSGKIAVARVNCTVGMTAVTNANLDDLRNLGMLGISTTVTTKALQISYDLSVTGALAITGAGFRPSAAIVFAVKDNTAGYSFAFIANDGTDWGIDSVHYDVANSLAVTDKASDLRVAAGTIAYTTWASWDADGMTLTRSKVGLPTGTGYLQIKFIK